MTSSLLISGRAKATPIGRIYPVTHQGQNRRAKCNVYGCPQHALFGMHRLGQVVMESESNTVALYYGEKVNRAKTVGKHRLNRLRYPELLQCRPETPIWISDAGSFNNPDVVFVAQRTTSKRTDDWTHFHGYCFRFTLSISTASTMVLWRPPTKVAVLQFSACSSRYCCCYFTRSVAADNWTLLQPW